MADENQTTEPEQQIQNALEEGQSEAPKVEAGEQDFSDEPAKIIKEAPVLTAEEKKRKKSSERVSKMYGTMKHQERQIAAHDAQIAEKNAAMEAMRVHQEELGKAVEKLNIKDHDRAMPDSLEEPEKHAKWVVEKAKMEIEAQKPTIPEAPKPSQQDIQQQLQQARLKDMESTVADVIGKDKYYDTIKPVREAMQANPMLQQQILNTPNPFKAAYDYGAKMAQQTEDTRKAQQGQNYVEGGASAPATTLQKLTPEEIKTVAAFNKQGIPITQKEFAQQRALINGGA